jgi:hypothetical protein
MKELTHAQKRDLSNAALIELIAAVLECERKFAELEREGWPPITRRQIVNRVLKLIDGANKTWTL